jgi:hypothetical protein
LSYFLLLLVVSRRRKGYERFFLNLEDLQTGIICSLPVFQGGLGWVLIINLNCLFLVAALLLKFITDQPQAINNKATEAVV